MTPQQFFDKYQGQSLLYDNNPADRGQCVQAVCFYVVVNGKPVIWADASIWFTSNSYSSMYDRITNTPDAVPQTGDIIVWSSFLPNSGGAGHIAVCLQPLPGTGTFISVDSNWGGKTVHKVTHNYSYVIGWLRFKSAQAPVTQGDEMITNNDQATKLYKMLRPNGGASQAEIDGTTGKRSFAEFVNTAQAEIEARDANLKAQAEQVAQLSVTINQLNQTMTELRSNDQNDAQTITKATDKIADLTAQLETQHDLLAEAQKTVQVTQDKPSFLVRLLVKLFAKK